MKPSPPPSSPPGIPPQGAGPRHVAIIMDGNGRWAKKRHLPRFAGHKRGVEAVRAIVKACAERGVGYLTLFAFSSENWRRPPDEVALLMQLFIGALENEVQKLHRNGIRLKLIGDQSRFDRKIQALIAEGQRLTAGSNRLTFTIAANYGGRRGIPQAFRGDLQGKPFKENTENRESDPAGYLSMSYPPEPGLFIRTGGEPRQSHFPLLQVAHR